MPKKDTRLYREAGISAENKRKWESLYLKEKFFSFDKKTELIKCIKELIKMHQTRVLLRVNKKKIPFERLCRKYFDISFIAFVKALKGVPEEIDELEFKIKLPNNLTKKGFRLYFKHDLKYGPVTQPGRVPAF